MKGYSTALALSLLVGIAGAARADIKAVIDFDDRTRDSNATLVTDQTGSKLSDVTQAKQKGVQTSGDASTEGLLYIDVKDDLFKNSTILYAEVQYFNAGTDSFGVRYNGTVDDGTGTLSDAPDLAAGPNPKVKSNTNTWATQVFTLPNPKLNGGLPGKADLAITDMGDGPEIIGRIILSDTDPRSPSVPRVSADHPIVIDGVKSAGEWDNAYTFSLDSAEYDALDGNNWTGKEDFTGTYSFKWDDKGLYILGEVTDDTPFHNDRDANLWEGDGVELYIGLDQSNPARTAYNTDTDFQVITTLPQTNQYTGVLQNGGWIKGPEPVAAGDLSIVKTDRGYMFEYVVRWDVLKSGYKPTEGQKIGFNMFGDDGDDSPGGQDTAMTPFKNKRLYADPSGFATGQLVAAVKPQ